MQGNGRAYKFFLLGSLYFTQMLPLTFFFSMLPVLLRRDGMSLEKLAYIPLIGLLYSLKFLWAPYVDRGAGNKNHYKRIVLAMSICYAIVAAIASQIDPLKDTLLLCFVLMVGLTFLGTQDIAVDAIATKILKKDEVGVGNGIQAAGAFFGYLVGGGVMTMLFDTVGGWGNSVLILSGALVLGLLPIFFLDESPGEVKSRANIRDVFSFFKNVKILPLLAVAVFSGMFLEVAYHKIRPLLTDAGFSNEKIGLYLSIIGMVSGILSSVLFGFLVKKWGFKKIFILSMCITPLAFVSFLFPAAGYLGDLYVLGVVLLGGFCSGALHATVYAFFMTNAREGKEGSDFTLQNALSFLCGKIFVAPLFGRLGDSQGYLTLFIVAGCFHILLIAISIFVVRKSNADNDVSGNMTKNVGEMAESEAVSM